MLCSRVIEDGDVVAVDVSCFLHGYHGDNCRTFIAGNAKPEIVDLMKGVCPCASCLLVIRFPAMPRHAAKYRGVPKVWTHRENIMFL